MCMYIYIYIYISKHIVYVVDGSWLIYSSTGSWIIWLSRQVVKKQLDRWVKNGCSWPKRHSKMKELPENYCHDMSTDFGGKIAENMGKWCAKPWRVGLIDISIRNTYETTVAEGKSSSKASNSSRGDPCSFCCWRSIVEFSDQWLSTRNKYQNVWIRQQKW